MPDIRPRSGLEDYLDQIMNEEFGAQESSEGFIPEGSASFDQRFQGTSPEEMLRQRFIEDLLRRNDDPVVYEEVAPENRSRSIRGAHRV